MLRKIIFIGQSSDNVIYFDIKNKTILKAQKNSLLDMEKTKNNTKNIVIILVTIPVVLSIVTGIVQISLGKMYYSHAVLILLAILWIIEATFLTYILEKALYGPIKHKSLEEIQKGTKEEFRQASRGNNLWNIFGDKKVTHGKKVIMWILVISISTLTISILPMIYAINKEGQLLGHQVGSEIILLSMLGVMPFICILLIFINNPIRWLVIVEKYQKRKL
jgi:hypothetical protein